MRYQDARNQIRSGDLLFFRGNRFFSWIVKRTTLSRYSHVGIAVWVRADSGNERHLMVLEAMEGVGVRLHPLSEYLAAGEHVDWFRVTDRTLDVGRACDWALRQVGKQYASFRQLRLSFGPITKRIAAWLRLPTKVDRDRFFCSCIVVHFVLSGGWCPDSETDPTRCSPGDVSYLPFVQFAATLKSDSPELAHA